MKMSPQGIKNLATALFKAQSEMKGAKATADNPFFKSKYANLENVHKAISEPLAKNELSISQMSSIHPETQIHLVETAIMHSSGEWISGTFPIYGNLTDPQKHKSAHTLLRRAALMAAVGVPEIDDDGNAATDKPTGTKPAQNPSGGGPLKAQVPLKSQGPPLQGDSLPKPPNPPVKPQYTQTAQNNANAVKSSKKVTEGQIKRLWAIQQKHADKWSVKDLMAAIRVAYDIGDVAELNMKDYDAVIDLLENYAPSAG